MKRILVISLAMVMFLNVTGCKKGKQKNNDNQNPSVVEDGGKKNNSEELNKEKTFGNYKVSDIGLVRDNEQDVFVAIIQNISNDVTQEGLKYIAFLNNDGTEIYKMAVFVKALQPNESIEIKGNINVNVIDAYNFKLID